MSKCPHATGLFYKAMQGPGEQLVSPSRVTLRGSGLCDVTPDDFCLHSLKKPTWSRAKTGPLSVVFSHLQTQLTSGTKSLTQSSLGDNQVIPQLKHLKGLPGPQTNEVKGYRKLEVAECCLTRTPSRTCAQGTVTSKHLDTELCLFHFLFLTFQFCSFETEPCFSVALDDLVTTGLKL